MMSLSDSIRYRVKRGALSHCGVRGTPKIPYDSSLDMHDSSNKKAWSVPWLVILL